jgi:formylglycine-generating enzyme required for sulfatase activity
MRGGAWHITPDTCRSATRGWDDPDARFDVGFRVVVLAARTP